MRQRTKNLLEIHAAVMLFGLSGLFGRFLNLPAVFIVLGRVFFASVTMFAVFRIRKVKMGLRSGRDALLLLVAGAVLAFHWSAFYQTVKVSTVAIAVMTFSAFPIFLTFAEPALFKEKLKQRDLFFALLMLFGVYLIIPEFRVGNRTTLGIIWGMGSSLSYAVLSLMNRKLAENYRGGLVAFYEQTAAMVVLLPVLLFSRPAVSGFDLALLAVLGVVFTGVAHSLYISGMKTIRAQTAGMIAGLESVYGIAAAALILSEYPLPKEVAGGAVILGAAFLSTWCSARETCL